LGFAETGCSLTWEVVRNHENIWGLERLSNDDDMLHFYIGVIRLVLEYAVAVWHTGLTTDLSERLEAIQK